MKKTTLIIARHGNTFTKDQIPTRIGGKTDLPLIEEKKGLSIGKYLKDHNLLPNIIFAGPLLRTVQTAVLSIKGMELNEMPIIITELFREVDYGPDENKTEEQIQFRLGKGNLKKGKQIIDNWNKNGIVPNGWLIDKDYLIKAWKTFATDKEKQYAGQKILIITSNGIARFSPYLTASFDDFASKNEIKINTGALCIFEKAESDKHWNCLSWNINPASEIFS